MILAISIENTNTILCGMDAKESKFVECLSTSVTRTEIEYAFAFKNIIELHHLSVDDVEGAIISSVVPPVTSVVKDAVRRIFGKEALVIGPGVKTGMNILTENPAQLGSDLVASAVAGIHKYKAPMVIVSMGTATTLSVINEKKQYIGGMIIPGIKISSASLTRETAQLPKIGLEKPKKIIGTNTIECMKSGIINGTAASIDGCIKRIEKEYGSSIETIIATGANIKHILPYCEREMCLDETLLFQGLRLIYEKNQKS